MNLPPRAPRSQSSGLTVIVLSLLLSNSDLASGELFPVEEDTASPESMTAPSSTANVAALAPAALVIASDAHLKGQFGSPFDFPASIIPIAVMTLPNGKVLAYSAKEDKHVMWDPTLGTGTTAFTVETNRIGSDETNNIFCAGQVLLPPGIPNHGDALIAGGSAYVNGNVTQSNGISAATLIGSNTNRLTTVMPMKYPRWYPTAVTLLDGSTLLLGGRTDAGTVKKFAFTPEIRKLDGTWRELLTAADDEAYGATKLAWSYPRAWTNSGNNVFVLGHTGDMYNLNTVGFGTLTPYLEKDAFQSNVLLASVMYAPGKILSIRDGRLVVSIDIKASSGPEVQTKASLTKDRKYGSLTVLADGSVWANGGSAKSQVNGTPNNYDELRRDAYKDSELWNPSTDTWIPTASAAHIRLYHSTALLLKDGTVFTGGGGSPGPITQTNGEIYYPPYLFKQVGATSDWAPRPTITTTNLTQPNLPAEFSPGDAFSVMINVGTLEKITLVRMGAVTHNFNGETRFIQPKITKTTKLNQLEVTLPPSSSTVPPGYYMLFAWNEQGVPSIATIIGIKPKPATASN